MQTNFFTEIAKLMADDSRLIFTLERQQDGNFIVVVHYDLINESKNNKLVIQPLVFRKTTTEELDAQFLLRITEPVSEIGDLLINNRQINATIKQNRAKLDKSAQTVTPTVSTNAESSTPAAPAVKRVPPKYQVAMKKVDELEKKGLHRQAVGVLQSLKNFPLFKAEIEARIEQLKKAYDQPELFTGGQVQNNTITNKALEDDNNTLSSSGDHIPDSVADGDHQGDHTDDDSYNGLDPDYMDNDDADTAGMEGDTSTADHPTYMNH
ncbi:hypothetical protein [Chitinophaga arvensicola]|uniref:ParB-related ThiF-related cassette protein E domain-containing protein n=1 Tax=Chitinophaga arvensicola TaxID=29529 RepID=A0A1I0PQ45_9BACT|nr:hypothetical protein [Chitinophaga arvensicola]SEW16381.1 hypothetical protein SAMN04488122_0904 [Chitinophaga arvensicola]